MTEPVRVAVVGARRGRQGLGEHLARFAVLHGAVVPAFVGTTAASVAQAREVLLGHGIDAEGFTDVEALLDAHEVDALIVATPAEHHLQYLETALDRGVHVLCEKPLVWGGADPVAAARRMEQGFGAARLVLHENCQWPLTLPAFRTLHPDAPEVPARAFDMWLSPTSRGARMLVDAVSHPLSLLQALAPGEGRVEGVAFSTRDPGTETLGLDFGYLARGVSIRVGVRLATCPHQPRPAGYAVDGFRAERRVRTRDYALEFEDAGRRVPVPDPMGALVAGFLDAVRGGVAPDGPQARGLAHRLGLLTQIVAAFGDTED